MTEALKKSQAQPSFKVNLPAQSEAFEKRIFELEKKIELKDEEVTQLSTVVNK